jgi:hypothetical protein
MPGSVAMTADHRGAQSRRAVRGGTLSGLDADPETFMAGSCLVCDSEVAAVT